MASRGGEAWGESVTDTHQHAGGGSEVRETGGGGECHLDRGMDTQSGWLDGEGTRDVPPHAKHNVGLCR